MCIYNDVNQNYGNEKLLCFFSGMVNEIMSKINIIGKSEYQCLECGHTTMKKTNLIRHIESKHMHLEALSCHYCNKMCPSKNALSTHVSRYHRQL